MERRPGPEGTLRRGPTSLDWKPGLAAGPGLAYNFVTGSGSRSSTWSTVSGAARGSPESLESMITMRKGIMYALAIASAVAWGAQSGIAGGC